MPRNENRTKMSFIRIVKYFTDNHKLLKMVDVNSCLFYTQIFGLKLTKMIYGLMIGTSKNCSHGENIEIISMSDKRRRIGIYKRNNSEYFKCAFEQTEDMYVQDLFRIIFPKKPIKLINAKISFKCMVIPQPSLSQAKILK